MLYAGITTLTCSTSRLPNCFKFSGIVNVMCLVIPAAACLLTLGTLGAIIIAQWAQWSSDYKMWSHSICMHTGRYRHQSFWNKGLFSSTAEVTGFWLSTPCYRNSTVFLKLHFSSSSGTKLPLAVESFGLLNDIFPFRSIVVAGYPIFNLHLANVLFDVNLPSVLGFSVWSFG